MTPMKLAIQYLDDVLSGKIKPKEPGAITAKFKELLLLEKKAIKDAVNFGGQYDEVWEKIAEQYYNETYGEL
jgi:hypothetical protein